jgi:hypothetical protein
MNEKGQVVEVPADTLYCSPEPHALVLRNAILEFCLAKGNELPSSKSLGKKLAGVRARVKAGKSISSEDHSGTLTWFVHSPDPSTEF